MGSSFLKSLRSIMVMVMEYLSGACEIQYMFAVKFSGFNANIRCLFDLHENDFLA